MQRTLAALTGIDRRERRPINGERLLRFWETVIGGNKPAYKPVAKISLIVIFDGSDKRDL